MGCKSASRLRFRFGQVKLNNHSSFGVRRLVAALHSALVICPSFARILTCTFNCTPSAWLYLRPGEPCVSLLYWFLRRLFQNLDSPIDMRTKVYYHDNCFDGLASAAVFSNFYGSAIRQGTELVYEGLAHRAGQLFIDVQFDGDENAIVDFKYSSDHRLTWWFDHHQSAFLNPQDEAHFRGDMSGKKFHDPTYKSCTKFITETVREKFGFDSSRLEELIRWADIIDVAQFKDARAAVELKEPAMKLMMVIEGIRNPSRLHGLIEEFQQKKLEEIVALEWVQEAFKPLY